MVLSQSRVQQLARIAVMKIALDTGKENATKITKIKGNVSHPNLGNNLDVSA